MAPDAKVAFVDLADSSGSGIKIPQDLSRRYYPLTYAVGARVHSDSWGSASQDYDYMASEVDLFTWENQVRTVSPKELDSPEVRPCRAKHRGSGRIL